MWTGSPCRSQWVAGPGSNPTPATCSPWPIPRTASPSTEPESPTPDKERRSSSFAPLISDEQCSPDPPNFIAAGNFSESCAITNNEAKFTARDCKRVRFFLSRVASKDTENIHAVWNYKGMRARYGGDIKTLSRNSFCNVSRFHSPIVLHRLIIGCGLCPFFLECIDTWRGPFRTKLRRTGGVGSSSVLISRISNARVRINGWTIIHGIFQGNDACKHSHFRTSSVENVDNVLAHSEEIVKP